MPATIFSGSSVKTLKKILSLNGGIEFHSGTTDPTSVAVSAPIGSLYLNETSGKTYRKNDSGSSTNWSEYAVVGASAGQFQAVVAATPISGFSTHTTLTSAQTSLSAGQQALVMPGSYAETLTMSKRLKWVCGGYDASITNLVWGTGADNSHVSGGLRITGTVTIDANTHGTLLDIYVPTALAISQDSTSKVFIQGHREDG